MYVVLLSGGSGKRLWPLSNDLRSKQYIKLLPDPYDPTRQVSMVQRVWKQLERAGLAKGALVCAGRSQQEILQAELGDVPLAMEPERRDTFPAIALSCTYLVSKMGAKADDVVCFIPVDPYVDDIYFDTLKKLEQVVKTTSSDIVLMGAEPTYPSSKYGYILPAQKHEGYIDVAGFKEKPEEPVARELIKKGALWNCGVFCFRVGLILEKLKGYDAPTTYHELFDAYGKLPKRSFDYEVLESAKNLKAVPFGGMWKDLGTWNTLTDEMSSNTHGRVIMSDKNENTHAINELDIPVVVSGMKDTVVVAAYDGILVSSKEESAHLKDLLKEFQQSPMYEEKRWGVVKTIDVSGTENRHTITRKVLVRQGMRMPLAGSTRLIILLEGSGTLDSKELRVGEPCHIPATSFPVFQASSDSSLLDIIQEG